MSSLILPSRFNQQPQHPTAIAQENPIIAGLIGVYYPNSGPTSVQGTVRLLPGLAGVGFGSSTNSRWQVSATSKVSLSPTWTILTILQGVETNASNGGTSLYSERPDANQIIKLAVGDGNTNSAVLVVRDAAGTNLVLFRGVADVRTMSAPRVIVGVRRGPSSHAIYVNGRLDSTSTVNGAGTFNNSAAHIAGDPQDTSSSLTGTASIPLVLLWNRALSDVEIANISANPWQVSAAPARRLWAISAVTADIGGSESTTKSSVSVDLSTQISLSSSSASQTSASADVTVGSTPLEASSVTGTSATTSIETQIALSTISATDASSTASISTQIALSASSETSTRSESQLVTAADTVTSVTVTPAAVTVGGGVVVDFTWTVSGTGTPSQAVTLSVTLGTIASDGTFVAPAATSVEQTGTLTATSVQDSTKSGTATFTVPAAGATPTMATRTVSIPLGNASGSAANLTGLSVSFHDEPLPHLTTVPRYQSATETTDASGVLNFSFSSTLPIGGQGLLVVQGAAGVHYNGPFAVS